MKTVILCGGFGTRIQEESIQKPKPMVEIGGIPILAHIMKIYSHYGFDEFVVCLGYKGYQIKEYFLNYYYHNYDIAIDLKYKDLITIPEVKEEPWIVNLINTGLNTATAGRIKKIEEFIAGEFINGEAFAMTYGDGLSDVNLKDMLLYHITHKKLATMLAATVPSKFGSVRTDKEGLVQEFHEKPVSADSFINAGFFILEPEVFDYIKGDEDSWEYDILPKLVKDEQLMAYRYNGFFKCMDSIKDRDELRKMWDENKAPWKIWKS